ncbi:unnamed protein product [Didymodactylos carnosus]|uniref:Integrase catalytic domain-containing protein n=1 Tax=Didymodactylos carnosus TaxID=1234261 RepID=A0A8S2N218_9BILA|nr:unnamed protein product [Didymodactylos carnosus]
MPCGASPRIWRNGTGSSPPGESVQILGEAAHDISPISEKPCAVSPMGELPCVVSPMGEMSVPFRPEFVRVRELAKSHVRFGQLAKCQSRYSVDLTAFAIGEIKIVRVALAGFFGTYLYSLEELKNQWRGLVIINGRPRHPQSQGLVERGNQTLELALGKWMRQNNTKAWSKGELRGVEWNFCLSELICLGLSPVIYALNTSYAESTKKTPYEVVFGQQPRCDLEMWKILADSGIEDEEDLPADFAEQLNEPQPMIDVEPVDTEYVTHNPIVTDTTATIPLDATLVQPANLTDETQTVPMNLPETPNEDLNDNSVIDVPPACLNPTNRHKRIRDEAEENYLKTIEKRQKLYDAATQRSAYVIGDLVGLKIDRVDRTNVTAKILPCKIMSIQISSNDTNMYRLCTKTCILSTSYQIQDLSDFTKCNFNDLRTVDPSTLPTKTFIQACQEYMCISSGVDMAAEACHCKGQCATKHCPCKAKKVKCGTKCHRSKKKVCSNV